MPQLDISKIQVFHRDYYGATVSAANTIENITVISEPVFTDLENKADNFFTVKPRRFSFKVRLDDTTFFTSSTLNSHPNYPNLSDYMVKIFNIANTQIFEGIIDAEIEFEYDTNTISIMCYDPIVIIADSEDQYSPNDLAVAYKDPHDLLQILMTNIIAKYFINSATIPTYINTWNYPDWGLANYFDIIDWEDKIEVFYSNSITTYKAYADGVLAGLGGSLTDVYDYSRLDFFRRNSPDQNLSMRQIVAEFIGIRVYADETNKNSVVAYYHFGVQYNFNDGSIQYLDNSSDISYETILSTDNITHKICKFTGRDIPYYYNGSVLYQSNKMFYSFKSAKEYTADNSFLSKDYKTYILSREVPNWNASPTGDTEAMEYYGIDKIAFDIYRYALDKMIIHKGEDALQMEGGTNLIDCENALTTEDEYIYRENSGYLYYGRDIANALELPTITSDAVDPEEGYIRLWDNSGSDENYNVMQLKINHDFDYTLNHNSFSLTIDHFYKIGNISKFYKFLPTNIQMKYYDVLESNDYIYKTLADRQYYKIHDLLKMVLLTMNLYIYYTDEFVFEKTSFDSLPSFTSIPDSDIIGWNTSGNEVSKIDINNYVEPLSNYTANALEPYYNDIIADDRKKASCTISRVVNSYNTLALNSGVTILAENWRIEKIKSTLAYHEVVLTKYIVDP
jgi:hypothetical protein